MLACLWPLLQIFACAASTLHHLPCLSHSSLIDSNEFVNGAPAIKAASFTQSLVYDSARLSDHPFVYLTKCLTAAFPSHHAMGMVLTDSEEMSHFVPHHIA
jgi:hypothetical protein